MNPHAARLALILGALAAGVFIAGLVICTLLYGCGSALPPEPAFVETVAASSRDAN